MSDVNTTFIITLVIIGIGYILKRVKVLKEENGFVISKLIFNITLPATILKFTSSVDINISYILLPLISIIFSTFMALLGFLSFRKYPRNLKGALIMTMVGFNIANFSFPLVEGIWGDAGMPYIALIDAGNAFSIFVLCYLIGSIYSPKNQEEQRTINLRYIFNRLIRSTPLISYIVALTINFTNLVIPTLLTDLIDLLARANSALVLLLLGVFLNFKFDKNEWLNILKILVLRYGMGLIAGFFIFTFFPQEQFSFLFRIMITLSLILPVGLAVIPFSVEFNYEQKLITMLVNLSMIISFILLWIMVLFLNA
ncbi:MAG: AEC family transporter [Candidatus Lokiarchaeota archaeon]|nr:AEC family transporter [Candidatus Lokiarchaeota archaeon]